MHIPIIRHRHAHNFEITKSEEEIRYSIGGSNLMVASSWCGPGIKQPALQSGSRTAGEEGVEAGISATSPSL